MTLATAMCASVLGACTWLSLQPIPPALGPNLSDLRQPQFLDRYGAPLTITYDNPWNVHDYVRLHTLPFVLQRAFVLSEDKRFFEHRGVDWLARAHAALQNLHALRAVRGASTITEQVVRLLHPRPRTLWSRWLEGIEAQQLERRFSKATILEFYINQIPYAHRRRGVAQAARDYFDRELDTLNVREMLALVVLVRAPARLDLAPRGNGIERPLRQLAQRLHAAALLSDVDYREVVNGRFELAESAPPVDAAHFVNYIRTHAVSLVDGRSPRVRTTLDATLQRRVQQILDTRLQDLRVHDVSDGAVLLVDHRANEVLAWVNGGGFAVDRPGAQIDAVTVARQPGSALKPFLYALALEKGWTAATLIEDTPLAQRVGMGLHAYRNYSRQHYGPLRLRDALANSLNIPAIRTVDFIGRDTFLRRLHALGFASLARHPDHYGDGLALGNGEVTLLELVQAYATLARGGVSAPLSTVLADYGPAEPLRQIFSEEVSSLIGNILSDPDARRLEFGAGSLLRFPVQTAVKTGTSSDYRDAWALGYSHRYTVGVWMGNLDQRPMRDVSGSVGPALVLRSVFAELNRYEPSQPLKLSRRLRAVRICRDTGIVPRAACPSMLEWFSPGSAPAVASTDTAPRALAESTDAVLRLAQPTPGLQLAMDPRIPDQLEMFPFQLAQSLRPARIEWLVDGRLAGVCDDGQAQFLWALARGAHKVQARVWLSAASRPLMTEKVSFTVK